ncbi:MAG: hypothetical protein ACYC9O_01545 [Candidatus Latescibacterota bacterium]
MKKMSLYEESIAFGFVTFIVAVFILIAVFFCGMIIYQTVSGLVGDNPAPNWYFGLMFLIFAGSAVILANLRTLRIRIDERGFRANYGIFRQEYDWDAIESAAIDTASFFRYGGFGIRYTRAEGYWRRGYTLIGAPRVVLTLRRGTFRQFAFSTHRPEEVVRVIGEYLGSESHKTQ